jgi:hypothetical protein
MKYRNNIALFFTPGCMGTTETTNTENKHRWSGGWIGACSNTIKQHQERTTRDWVSSPDHTENKRRYRAGSIGACSNTTKQHQGSDWISRPDHAKNITTPN